MKNCLIQTHSLVKSNKMPLPAKKPLLLCCVLNYLFWMHRELLVHLTTWADRVGDLPLARVRSLESSKSPWRAPRQSVDGVSPLQTFYRGIPHAEGSRRGGPRGC